MQFHSRQRKPLTINIVSMIDILSILLIFFIVTTTFKKAEPRVEISLPESETASDQAESLEPTVIYITVDKRIFIGDQEVQIDTLESAIKQTRNQNPSQVFTLEADEGIPLGFFIKVTDQAKKAGLTDLSLNTRKPETP